MLVGHRSFHGDYGGDYGGDCGKDYGDIDHVNSMKAMEYTPCQTIIVKIIVKMAL